VLTSNAIFGSLLIIWRERLFCSDGQGQGRPLECGADGALEGQDVNEGGSELHHSEETYGRASSVFAGRSECPK
jgi:hypothetical protein